MGRAARGVTLPVRPPETLSMRTRDGVRLDADVYVPDVPGRFPVLLMRQPYGRRIASTVCYAHPSWYAAQGYIVAIQDVRGRGTSEGTFRVFEHEAEDGADAVAWAAGLPGAAGAVGMYGFSYQGTNQLLAASLAPPGLRAVAPAMIGWDLRTDWAHEGGAFCLQNGLGWAIQLAAETARLGGDAEAHQELRRAAGAPPFDAPVAARPAVMQRHRGLSHYHDWIDRPEPDAYWDRISPAACVERIAAAAIPTLLVGGWHDSHLPGTLAAFRALSGRLPVRLVIGPWAHLPWGRRVGALDFGEAAAGGIDSVQLRWFDRWLRGVGEEEPAVRLFDLGARRWQDHAAWPSRGLSLLLGGTGRAANDDRDGALQPDAPADDNDEILVHDPWRPAPMVAAGMDRGAVDQRGDVLTFTGQQTERHISLAGDVAAHLLLWSDAADFDVACTLSRVTPTGQVFAFAEGYRRVRNISGPVAVPMRAACITLAPGEALRLSIAAASFPAFPVNPGTGEDPTRARAMDARIITLRVGHGSSVSIGG